MFPKWDNIYSDNLNYLLDNKAITKSAAITSITARYKFICFDIPNHVDRPYIRILTKTD